MITKCLLRSVGAIWPQQVSRSVAGCHGADKGFSPIRAFTLIEVLVVIAIVAILASLLLPTLSAAKVRGQQTRCKGNLRQLSIALRFYLDANGSSYPLMAMNGNRAGRPLFWFDLLSLTMPNVKWGEGVFKCPAYNWGVFEGKGDAREYSVPGGSYAYNAWGDGNGGLGIGMAGARQEQEVKAPANMYALGDAFTVQWTNNALFIGYACYPSPTVMNLQRPDPYFRLQKFPHSRRFNMLFVDGHIEDLSTNVLFGTNADCTRHWNINNQPWSR